MGIVSGYEAEFPDLMTGIPLQNSYGSNRVSKGTRKTNVSNAGIETATRKRTPVIESRPSHGKKKNDVGNVR